MRLQAQGYGCSLSVRWWRTASTRRASSSLIFADSLIAGEETDDLALRKELGHLWHGLVPTVLVVAHDGAAARLLLLLAEKLPDWVQEGGVGSPVLVDLVVGHPIPSER